MCTCHANWVLRQYYVYDLLFWVFQYVGFHICCGTFYLHAHLIWLLFPTGTVWIQHSNAGVPGSDIRCLRDTTPDTCLNLCFTNPNCISCIHKTWEVCCLKYISPDESNVIHRYGTTLYQFKSSSQCKSGFYHHLFSFRPYLTILRFSTLRR